VAIDGLGFELRLAEGGQVGVFLEQRPMWALVTRAIAPLPDARVLNLFGYTGGTSLAAASAGASVAHVDGARTAVEWARRNAALSGLTQAPIRWIVDDAEAFVGREARRGRRYDLVALDPPSYGHAKRGTAWHLEERLAPLISACAGILAEEGVLLVSAHTPGYDADRLGAVAADALAGRDPVSGRAAAGVARRATIVDAGPLDLRAESGALLPAGAFAAVALR
jgi:23S rRNA (cytosine1962-C5)-methyltransferase